MGFHICEFCRGNEDPNRRFSSASSGDVSMQFTSGRVWIMPDMILHYVADHGWKPPEEFIDDVTNSALMVGAQIHHHTSTRVREVGYLTGHLEEGTVPEEFVDKLQFLVGQAVAAGSRVQTRGMPIGPFKMRE